MFVIVSNEFGGGLGRYANYFQSDRNLFTISIPSTSLLLFAARFKLLSTCSCYKSVILNSKLKVATNSLAYSLLVILVVGLPFCDLDLTDSKALFARSYLFEALFKSVVSSRTTEIA